MMPTAQQRKQSEDLEQDQRETLSTLIAEQLIHSLGKPEDLRKVQVRLLWENCYRVNVLVGLDAAHVNIAKSYFVKANSDGKIVESTPTITRQY